MILSHLFTEFISRIFHLVDKTANLLLMSHGLNHERCLHAPTQCSGNTQLYQFVETAERHQLRKKSSVWVSLISVTYPPSSSDFPSCALARDAFLQSHGKKKTSPCTVHQQFKHVLDPGHRRIGHGTRFLLQSFDCRIFSVLPLIDQLTSGFSRSNLASEIIAIFSCNHSHGQPLFRIVLGVSEKGNIAEMLGCWINTRCSLIGLVANESSW